MITCIRLLRASLAALLLIVSARAADRQPQVPDLKVEKYTLPNGLEVILHEDHNTPVVGVNLWYKVGSKNEVKGRTGFAHLFEHMMFQGSKHHDNEYFGPIEKAGAAINGSTTTDRTNYFETLPTNGLELAIWLEADRMGFLLPALTLKKLDNQRDVVKNERRQRVDNVPYGQSEEKMLEAMFPPDHPYYHSVIGSMADLSAASIEDVSSFFRTYYVPNNASLCIAGDFQPAEAKALVAKYFGPIPSGPNVAKISPRAPVLTAPKTITMTDKVALSRTTLSWPTVERNNADESALDVLAAVLGQLPKENRLFQALQYKKPLATLSSAFHRTSDLAGELNVIISPRPGQKLDDLITIADAEIERLKTEGPTEEEVAKAQTRAETNLVLRLQAAGAKADFLNANNVESGDPLAYKKEMIKLFAVTPADVKRVATKYLTPNRIRLDVNPGPPTERAPEVTVDRAQQPEPTKPPATEAKDSFDRTMMPKLGANPKFTPPPVIRRKLSNGLEVLISERHELPILAVNLVVKGGEVLEPTGKQGLATLTGDLMTEGTTSRDSLELASDLAKIGTSLNANIGLESGGVAMTTLTKHTKKALELFTDVVLNPAFPEKELARLKFRRSAAVLQRADSADGIAGVVFPKILYGAEHPYGRSETAESIKGVTRDEIVAFHKRMFVPNNAALIVVGDTTADAIVADLEAALKSWKPGDAPKADLAKPEGLKPGVYLVDKPAAAQSVLNVGQVGVDRRTPDYFAINVMNALLGGQFSSRINLNLREEKGYTYGARSSFDFRQGPGPFEATAPVQTDVTKEALVELVKELTDITGPRQATVTELEFAKDRLIKGFPARFESIAAGGGRGPRGGAGGVGAVLAELFLYGLPDDYFTTYQAKVEAVTKAEVDRVATKYITPANLTILVVGDRSKVESAIKSLPFATTITILDAKGDPVSTATPAAGDGQ